MTKDNQSQMSDEEAMKELRAIILRTPHPADRAMLRRAITKVLTTAKKEERDRIAALCYQLEHDGEKMYKLIYENQQGDLPKEADVPQA